MKLHDLAPPKGATKAKRRVGRGTGGKGHKTAGRGTKGQRARNTVPVGFEGGQLPLMQRIPKLKGFKNPFRIAYTPVNLAALEALGADDVTVQVLVDAGLARPKALVKILGQGSLSRPVRGVGPRLLEVGRGGHHRCRRYGRTRAVALRSRAPAGFGQRPDEPLVTAPGQY